jgi:hypothetical protein
MVGGWIKLEGWTGEKVFPSGVPVSQSLAFHRDAMICGIDGGGEDWKRF